MSPTNLIVNQHEQVHIQAQAQEYERKGTVSTRVIDETTLRNSSSSLIHSTTLTFNTDDKDKDLNNNQGPLLFLKTPTP